MDPEIVRAGEGASTWCRGDRTREIGKRERGIEGNGIQQGPRQRRERRQGGITRKRKEEGKEAEGRKRRGNWTSRLVSKCVTWRKVM
jgi:hypothetical protein